MAIIKLPDTISANMTCAICGTKLTLTQATAGMQDACNHQGFACITHLYQVQALIIGWAGFMAAPRRQYRNIKGRS